LTTSKFNISNQHGQSFYQHIYLCPNQHGQSFYQMLTSVSFIVSWLMSPTPHSTVMRKRSMMNLKTKMKI